LTFDYVFTVSHKNIMLLTHVGQMLYSCAVSGQYGVTGLNIESFHFEFSFRFLGDVSGVITEK
jgi:hypothetical protein